MNELPGKNICGLCGLTIGKRPLTRHFDSREQNFCCLGCMNVYAILLESGVTYDGQDMRDTQLYKRSLALGLIANGERQTGKSPEKIPEDAPVQETLFQVSGMWCSSCAWLIEHVLWKERGVVTAEVFFASDLLKIKYSPQYLPPERLTQRLNQLGYKISLYTGENEVAAAEKRDLLLRFGIAGFLWLNLMTLSVALYVGYFEHIAGSISRFLPFVLMALATPVIFYSAKPILQLAWQGILNRTARMETLLGLGILAAYFYSAVQAFRGETHVYFDTASAIVTLVLLGKLLERNAKERTAKAISVLYRMMPKKVRVQAKERENFISVEALKAGDLFIVKAGERVPADGVLLEGATHTDESLLTGEAAPVNKEIGSTILSGSLNLSNVIKVQATKGSADSTLAQIIRLVENALSNRTALEKTVDQVSRIFVPSVIAIAALTFFICWWSGLTSPGDALLRAITVLVIACPCALGMATPLAITAAIGAASRQGILVSDSRILETIGKVNTVVFDKTGTITQGDFSLLDIQLSPQVTFAGIQGGQSLNPQPVSDELIKKQVFSLIASLEQYSEHPLGQAIVRHAGQLNCSLQEATDIQIHKGKGITGKVAGNDIFVGSRRFAEHLGGSLETVLQKSATDAEHQGHSVGFFGWQAQVAGLLIFGDRVKPETVPVIKELKRQKIQTLIVSGDAYQTTQAIAKQVGVERFFAEILPDEKNSIIQKLQENQQIVAMVGDGVNDAPALASADLGIAVASGTDTAMRAAAIVLMNNSLGKVLQVFTIAHKTMRVIRQNLFWAFLYNTLGISLAVTGLLTPIMAAGAMLLSSLSVIGNSLRLNASLNSKETS